MQHVQRGKARMANGHQFFEGKTPLLRCSMELRFA
jgi:hypothetical protein